MLRFSDHDVHSEFFIRSGEPYLFHQRESHLPINFDIDVMGTFKITRLSSTIGLIIINIGSLTKR